MLGRTPSASPLTSETSAQRDPRSTLAAASGVRDSDLKPAFRALQNAYIGLLRNPFYDPDHHSPVTAKAERRVGSTQITSKGFIREVRRIGDGWYPGVGSL